MRDPGRGRLGIGREKRTLAITRTPWAHQPASIKTARSFTVSVSMGARVDPRRLRAVVGITRYLRAPREEAL